MEPLVRLKLKPLGVWTTPWQADSLLGALACSWARSRGPQALRRDFLDPWLAGTPRFVISDAFPGDSLLAPAALPLWWDWAPEQRKAVKKLRWLTEEDFQRVQHGRKPHLRGARVSFRDHVRLRNTLSRATDATGQRGELFEVPFSSLTEADAHLTILARASDESGLGTLVEALELLGRTGYGADASVGHGGFELAEDPAPVAQLDDVPDADGFTALSTFQPAANDPTEGYWRVLVKYGKVAPDFHASAVFKRPQVMFEAGACFRTGHPPKPFYGTCIEPDRLLSAPARTSLSAIDVYPLQAAFALAVPIRWGE